LSSRLASNSNSRSSCLSLPSAGITGVRPDTRFFFFCFETESHYIGQTNLELIILSLESAGITGVPTVPGIPGFVLIRSLGHRLSRVRTESSCPAHRGHCPKYPHPPIPLFPPPFQCFSSGRPGWFLAPRETLLISFLLFYIWASLDISCSLSSDDGLTF
jgi:hypothetical protein